MVPPREEVLVDVAKASRNVLIMDGSDLALILEGRLTLPEALEFKRRRAAQEGILFRALPKLTSSNPFRRIGPPCLGQDHAEAIIEAVPVLDCDRLREATRGDGEVVEKADVAKQDQAEAVPAINESHRGFPLVSSAGIVVVVQTQRDGLVAGDDGAPSDGVQFLAIVVGQVKAKLVRQQVAREDRIGSGVDQAL